MKFPLLGLYVTSTVCILLLSVRIYFSQDLAHAYLFINLALAWTPYFLSLAVTRYIHQRKAKLSLALAGSSLWLLFFPNAPYIITDFVHLDLLPPIPLWYDTMMLFAFAFHGIVLGVASLQIMASIVEKKLGQPLSVLFLFSVVMLSSFGVYVGRILRWNSWDAIINPFGVAQSISYLGYHPLEYERAAFFIISFSLFFIISYGIFSPFLLSTKKNE